MQKNRTVKCAQLSHCTSVQPSQPLWTDFKGVAIQLLVSQYTINPFHLSTLFRILSINFLKSAGGSFVNSIYCAVSGWTKPSVPA